MTPCGAIAGSSEALVLCEKSLEWQGHGVRRGARRVWARCLQLSHHSRIPWAHWILVPPPYMGMLLNIAGKVRWGCFHICRWAVLERTQMSRKQSSLFSLCRSCQLPPWKYSSISFYVSLGISEQWGAKATMKSAVSRQFFRWHVTLCSIAALSWLPRQVY